MSPSTFHTRAITIAWLLLAGVLILGSQLCSTMWAFSNPAPHHWDNADYLNLAYNDVWAYHYGGPDDHRPGIHGLWDSLINRDHYRPPAYRVAALPAAFLGLEKMPMLASLRATSLLFFWLTLLVIFKTATIALPGPRGVVAGAIAAALVSLQLEVNWSIRVYGTEFTLYFAVALMLLCLARATAPAGHWLWMGLGFALGLGTMSKLSFVMLAGPACVVAFVFIVQKKLPGLSILKFIVAIVFAAAICFPWYRFHFFEAKTYGQDMTQFQRHSLHLAGLKLLKSWIELHTSQGLGIGVTTVLAAMTLLALVTIALRLTGTKSIILSPATISVLIAITSGIPLLLFQLLFSQSHNVRHMTPAYLPLTLAVTIAAAATGFLTAPWGWLALLFTALPLVQQIDRKFLPLTITADDVWDWDPLYQFCQQRKLRFPFIGRVGNAGQFQEPSIIYPWYKRGDAAFCDWLWRPEDGPFDWSKIEPKLAGKTIVLTAPGFAMPDTKSLISEPFQADNSHNTEFAEKMSHEAGWSLATKFQIGRVHQAEIWVFTRN